VSIAEQDAHALVNISATSQRMVRWNREFWAKSLAVKRVLVEMASVGLAVMEVGAIKMMAVWD
jgi:hypothetical protein